MINSLKPLILPHINALVLEDLISQRTLEATLSNKKVGYYVGSFDPLHLGHEDVANLPIQKGLCDYVLICPSWGRDNYKKRVDIKLRHDMVFSAFANNPKIIVTRLSPQDMQQQLTSPTDCITAEGKSPFEVAIPGLEFIGIMGSDMALSYHDNANAAHALMTGFQVTEKYYNHTIGGLMALPAKSFIVVMRTDDDISSSLKDIIDRPIIAVIKSEKEQNISSARVKKALNAGETIDHMVSPGVAKIICENDLYQG